MKRSRVCPHYVKGELSQFKQRGFSPFFPKIQLMKQIPIPHHEAKDRNAAAEQLPEAVENQLIDAWRREQAKVEQDNSEEEE